MRGLPNFYRTYLRVVMGIQLEYRASLVIWMIWLIIEPVILLSVWTAVANSSGGSVGGFQPGDFAAYYITLLLVTHVTQIWHMWEYDYNIRQGILSGKLLRPIHPIHYDLTENFSYKSLMLVIVIPALVILTLLFRPHFQPPLWSAVAFIAALLPAAILAFLAGWAVAMAAFWTTRIYAINQAYFVAMFFFSGQLAPLDLLPPIFQTIANLLPFRWFIAFPIELMLGRHTPDSTLVGFGMIALWIAICGVVAMTAWNRGIKRYAAVGG